MKLPRLLTQKRDPFARQKIRYILNQPVHKRAKVVKFSLPPIDDPHKVKDKPDDVISLDKTKKFEVKKFETIENHEPAYIKEREEETIRLRWTSRLEREAESISRAFSRADSRREDVLKLPKLVHVHKKDKRCRGPCGVCEASRIINASPVEKVFKEHREHGISCKCTVCETVNRIRVLPPPDPSDQEHDGGLTPRLLSQMQINQQLNLLRNTGSLTPIQMYSHRMIRFKLMQNHRRQTLPIRLQPNRLPNPFTETNWVFRVEIKRGHVLKVNMSFPDYVAKFRRKMVEIRSRFRETARLGLYTDYWVPPYQSNLQPSSSSSTPTVPYSNPDILYGNEVRNSPQLDEIKQNSFIEYSKEKDRHSSNNLVDYNNRRPLSKNSSRKSLSIEKVSFNNKESEDNLRPILPNPGKNSNQYRPNGLRTNLLKGEPLYGSRGNNYTSVVVPYYGRESDDLIAMGTIWSPNAQKNSGSNSANGIQNVTGKSVSMVSSSSSSTTVPQRKSVKPIMVQNAPAHSRSSFSKEAEPRYTDPVIGAPPSFQQRLMELSALESETIRYEKSKKVKKKVRDRDS